MTATAKAGTQQRGEAAAPQGNGAEGQLLDQVVEQTAARIDALAARYAEAIGGAEGHLRRALLMARGLERLRQAITPEVMSLVMQLMNSPNGFLCDRPNKQNNSPYPVDVVKEAFITALLRGFYPVGQEWCIIAGKFYGAQNGYRRKLLEVPGVSHVEEVPGTPAVHNGQTVVRVAVRWRMNGRPDQLLDHDGKPGRVYAVVSQERSGPDQLVGKALRKALKAAYEQATGSAHALPDDAADEPAPAEDQTQEAEAPDEQSPLAVVEALVAKHGLAAVQRKAVEELAKAGVPEARVLAALGAKRRQEVTVNDLVALREALTRLAEGEAPDSVFPPADAEDRAGREAIQAEAGA